MTRPLFLLVLFFFGCINSSSPLEKQSVILSLSTAYIMEQATLTAVENGLMFEKKLAPATLSSIVKQSSFDSLVSYCIERAIAVDCQIGKADISSCLSNDVSMIVRKINRIIRAGIAKLALKDKYKVVFTQYLILVKPSAIKSYAILFASVHVIYLAHLDDFHEKVNLVVSPRHSGSPLTLNPLALESFTLDLSKDTLADSSLLSMFRSFIIHDTAMLSSEMNGKFIWLARHESLDLDELYQKCLVSHLYLWSEFEYPSALIGGLNYLHETVHISISPVIWKDKRFLNAYVSHLFINGHFELEPGTYFDELDMYLLKDEEEAISKSLKAFYSYVQEESIYDSDRFKPLGSLNEYVSKIKKLFSKNGIYGKCLYFPLDCIRITMGLNNNSFSVPDLVYRIEKVVVADEEKSSSLASIDEESEEEAKVEEKKEQEKKKEKKDDSPKIDNHVPLDAPSEKKDSKIPSSKKTILSELKTGTTGGMVESNSNGTLENSSESSNTAISDSEDVFAELDDPLQKDKLSDPYNELPEESVKKSSSSKARKERRIRRNNRPLQNSIQSDDSVSDDNGARRKYLKRNYLSFSFFFLMFLAL